MTTQVTPGAVVRTADEADRRWFAGGGTHQWMATAAETGGAFHAFVDHLTRGKMTPLHLHPDADDSMYVVSGEIRYHADGEERLIGPGSFVTALRGTPHAFMVVSEVATVFAFQTPGSGESFYRDASDPLAAGEDGPAAPDIQRLQQVAGEHPEAVQILGPPPFSRP
jgi:quercetin dioxygenase-like cupin family protein